jgi:hypothetical protein
VGEISVKTGNNARNGGKNSLNRLIRCVCGKKSAQIREILISESAWEEMTCLFAPSLEVNQDYKNFSWNRVVENTTPAPDLIAIRDTLVLCPQPSFGVVEYFRSWYYIQLRSIFKALPRFQVDV